MVVGSFDAWLNSARINNCEFQRSLEASGWSAAHATTVITPKTLVAPCATGKVNIKPEITKADLPKPVQRLSLLTVELREKQANLQPGDGVRETSQAPTSGGNGSLLPRAMSEPDQLLEFDLADLTRCDALSSPLDRAGLEASCDLGQRDRPTGCSELHGTRMSTISDTETCGYYIPLMPHRHHAAAEAPLRVTNGWSITAATSAAGKELLPSASEAEGGEGNYQLTSAEIRVRAATGISEMGSRTSEKHNTYDKTVRGGHPRAAGWRCGGSSTCDNNLVASESSSLPGPWGVALATAPVPSRMATQPHLQLRSSEPLLLSDMLRNALYRN
ncbi:hypothetical protein VaNZ11_003187 [Volvox africanus]|uniref:Uncharacterized protein n=1 Tax=Volvox africanus TaxID=51714 RepID=A0ABQ5RTM2_9CHLO|nr:hypothetical protein VaNZ11_003187 [Volvox africanus]